MRDCRICRNRNRSVSYRLQFLCRYSHISNRKDIVMTIPTTIVHPEALPMELIQNYNPYSYAPEPAMPHPYAESYQLEPPRPQFVAQQYSAPPSPLFTPYAPSPVQPYPSPYASSPVQANPYFAHHASLPNTPQFVPHAALPNVPVNPAYRATPPNEYVNDHRAPLPAPVHNGAQVWLPPVSHPIAPPIVPVRPSSAGDIPQAPPSLPVAHAVYHPEQTQLHAIPNEAPKEEPRQIEFPSMAEPTSQVVSPISRPLPIPAALSSPNIQQPQPLPPPAPGARLEDRVPPPPNPPSASIAPPDTQSLSPPSNALGLPTLDIATALTQPAGVLSPRPRISPRMSFSNTESDRNVKVASMKSAPVEELERMAEQVRLEEEKERAAGTVGVINGEMSVAKTLPGPPVPSGKGVDVVKPAIPKVSEIFSFHAIPAGPKKPQGQGSESGLDALERRLSKAAAAERWLSAAPNPTLKHSVGGHKKIPSGPRQDTQTRSRESSRQRRAGKEGGLPPMPMPRSVTPEVQRVQEPLLVPLPVTSTSRSPSGSRERGRSPRGESVLNGPRSPARSPAKPEAAPSREAEMYLLRAQAVGRVGSWLDEVDHSDTGVHHVPWATLSGQAIPKTSSGFRSTKKAPTPNHATNLQLLFSENPAEDQIIQPLHSEEPPLIPVTKPPPPTLQEAAATAQIPMLKSKYASPLLTAFPPPQLEKKYDVRSARGGRGGVVTALTSVWGNDAKNEITQPAIFAPRPKPSFKVPTLPGPTIAISSNSNGYPMRNYEPRMALKASASTPAEINGTVARPVISSAASLARPRPVVPEHGGLLMASKSLPESIGGDVRRGNKPHTGSSPPVGVGRAKLRELIAKYQG
ncbi:hypothetical protein FRC02_004705 [Tulasnella sp. 418]|nr:hypothetical protein FRC02_004705 [Tulasnella sp. 418]